MTSVAPPVALLVDTARREVERRPEGGASRSRARAPSTVAGPRPLRAGSGRTFQRLALPGSLLPSAGLKREYRAGEAEETRSPGYYSRAQLPR